jgi:hypothetical protein
MFVIFYDFFGLFRTLKNFLELVKMFVIFRTLKNFLELVKTFVTF